MELSKVPFTRAGYCTKCGSKITGVGFVIDDHLLARFCSIECLIWTELALGVHPLWGDVYPVEKKWTPRRLLDFLPPGKNKWNSGDYFSASLIGVCLAILGADVGWGVAGVIH